MLKQISFVIWSIMLENNCFFFPFKLQTPKGQHLKICLLLTGFGVQPSDGYVYVSIVLVVFKHTVLYEVFLVHHTVEYGKNGNCNLRSMKQVLKYPLKFNCVTIGNFYLLTPVIAQARMPVIQI